MRRGGRAWVWALVALVVALLAAADPTGAAGPTPAKVRRAAGDYLTYVPVSGRAMQVGQATSAASPLDAIAQAQAAGTLSADQAATYALQAMVGDPALPAQYASLPSDAHTTGGHVYDQVLASWSQLSPQTQQALRPYLVRPNDPGSYFSKGSTAASRAARAVSDTNRPKSYQRWESAAGGRVWVWADPNDLASTYTAEAIANLLGRDDDRILAPIEQMMGVKWAGDTGLNALFLDVFFNDGGANFDDRLDVYAVPLGTMGETVTSTSHPSASYVLINEALSGEELDYSLRHELFHVIQYLFKLSGSVDSMKWWLEPAADWSVTHFSPSNSFVYVDHAHFYLDRPHKRLDLWGGSNTDRLHAYGAFLWPTVLDGQLGGGTGGAIRSVFQQMAGAAPLEAIQSVVTGGGKDLVTVWRDFVVANVNQKWVRVGKDGSPRNYGAWNPFYDKPIPDLILKKRTLSTGNRPHVENSDLKVDIDRLGAQYFDVKLDSDVRQVLFHLEDWTKTKGNGVVALKRKKGETWDNLNVDDAMDDWTQKLDGEDENWRYLCLDKKDQRVEEMILVFFNADPEAAPDDDLTATVKTELSNVTCRWQGRIVEQSSGGTTLTYAGVSATTDGLDEVTYDVTFETQINPLDVRPAARRDGLDQNPNAPHRMPIWPTRWTVSAKGHQNILNFTQDCDLRDSFSGSATHQAPAIDPDNPDPGNLDKNMPPTLAIWGDNYNNFSFTGWDTVPLAHTYACGDGPATEDKDYLVDIGREWTTPDSGLFDQIRTVSADGTSISATWVRKNPNAEVCGTLLGAQICAKYEGQVQTTIDLKEAPETDGGTAAKSVAAMRSTARTPSAARTPPAFPTPTPAARPTRYAAADGRTNAGRLPDPVVPVRRSQPSRR